MKLIIWTLSLTLSSVSWAAVTTFEQALLIPARESSCLSRAEAKETGTTPVLDVDPSYYRLSKVDIHNDTDGTLTVNLVRLTRPSIDGNQVCEIQGPALQALGFDDNLLPGQTTMNSCSLVCGGIEIEENSVTPGTLEVFATSKKGSIETPVEMSTYFDIINL